MYFHSIFSLSAQIKNLDDFVQDAQQKVYDYFANTYDTIDIPDSEFQNKYLNVSAKTLKRTLKQLKDNRADIEEIKFVSKLIRSKISKGCPRNDQDLQTELEIKFKKNFWSGKHVNLFSTLLQAAYQRLLRTNAYNTFCRCYLKLDRKHIYVIPDWIPELPPPVHAFNDACPS